MKDTEMNGPALLLAERLSKAISADEQAGYCDPANGLLGPSLKRLVCDLSDVQEAYGDAMAECNELGYACMPVADVIKDLGAGR
jgi:hypothetical protein